MKIYVTECKMTHLKRLYAERGGIEFDSGYLDSDDAPELAAMLRECADELDPIASSTRMQGADEPKDRRIAELEAQVVFLAKATGGHALLVGAEDAQPVAFEEWAIKEGLIAKSHGLLSVSSSCDVARKAWNAALATCDAAPRDAKDAQRYRDIRAISVAEMTWPSDAEFDAYIDETIAGEQRDK